MMWSQAMQVPPLVTSSPVGTPRAEAGVLGFENTSILLGNAEVLGGTRNGWRFRGGVWLDPDTRWGLEAEYWELEDVREEFVFGSEPDGTPILARPFFNINPRNPFTQLPDPPARQDSQLASFPNELRGAILVGAQSSLSSFGLTLRRNLACQTWHRRHRSGVSRVDFLVGYRHTMLEDDLLIAENLSALGPSAAAYFRNRGCFSHGE